MKDYVDLVLVKHAPRDKCAYLFYAPFCSGLKENETVIVDTKYGDQLGFVEDVIPTPTDSKEYKFILKVMQVKELKRVKARTNSFDYSDEDYIKGIE